MGSMRAADSCAAQTVAVVPAAGNGRRPPRRSPPASHAPELPGALTSGGVGERVLEVAEGPLAVLGGARHACRCDQRARRGHGELGEGAADWLRAGQLLQNQPPRRRGARRRPPVRAAQILGLQPGPAPARASWTKPGASVMLIHSWSAASRWVDWLTLQPRGGTAPCIPAACALGRPITQLSVCKLLLRTGWTMRAAVDPAGCGEAELPPSMPCEIQIGVAG